MCKRIVSVWNCKEKRTNMHVKGNRNLLSFFFFFCRAMYDLLKIPNIFFLFSTAAPCSGNTYFCHSNMCINNSLVCNGIQNCAYPWDENHCRGEYSAKYSLYNPAWSVCLSRKSWNVLSWKYAEDSYSPNLRTVFQIFYLNSGGM